VKEKIGNVDGASRQWAEAVLHVVKHQGYEPFWGNLFTRHELTLPGKIARPPAGWLARAVAVMPATAYSDPLGRIGGDREPTTWISVTFSG
jgi:hypothetical protein